MAPSINPIIVTEILDIEKSTSGQTLQQIDISAKNVNHELLLIRIHDIRNQLLKDKFKHIHVKLTKRELQIIILICEGKKTLEIAKILNLSKHTIESHRTNIFSKLDVRNSLELVSLAFKVGIINPNEIINSCT